MLSDEDDNDANERLKEWKDLLAEIAGNLYESLDDGCTEFNQYKEEYHKSYEFQELDDGDCPEGWSNSKPVPANGYTEDEVEKLSEAYYNREKEIENYREEQRRIGMEKMLKVWKHLWN